LLSWAAWALLWLPISFAKSLGIIFKVGYAGKDLVLTLCLLSVCI
jgi:hypothetical protein